VVGLILAAMIALVLWMGSTLPSDSTIYQWGNAPSPTTTP
jgi:hypothetical protein